LQDKKKRLVRCFSKIQILRFARHQNRFDVRSTRASANRWKNDSGSW